MDILLGLQWGDEGKGKIVDVLAEKYQVIARFQGGPNAGHTLEFDGKKVVLHQIPSGIFHKSILNVIGNGVVLDPVVFRKEVTTLQQHGVNVFDNLVVSRKTILIIPTHRLLDAASEQSKGEGKIGSTLKGISPAYQDKYGRSALRVGDITRPDFKEKYDVLVKRHLEVLDRYQFDIGGLPALEADFFDALELLKKATLVNSEYVLNEAVAAGKKVLAEGAQGSLLDIDFGSYPFVTSSSTTVAGACTGLGIAPRHVGEVIGITKAYCTRVGGGPFPTELNDAVGERIRQTGREFGATTGRPRRCGWLDLPALKYAIMLNGVTQLCVTKADVLNDFDEIKVCTHYRLQDGTVTEQLPYDLCSETVEPIYQTFKGWQTATSHLRDFNEVPAALREYLGFIEAQTGVKVVMLSVGPDRVETIWGK